MSEQADGSCREQPGRPEPWGPVARWVSGGQSGVDRAVLDAVIAAGAPYGGWCPAGGWAEDFPEPPGLLARYPGLRPTPQADPAQRTAWNVRDSDAVLIVLPAGAAASAGTDLTEAEAARLGRPVRRVTVWPGQPYGEAAADLRAWLVGISAAARRPIVLDVAGPRESEWQGGYDATRELLHAVLDGDGYHRRR